MFGRYLDRIIPPAPCVQGLHQRRSLMSLSKWKRYGHMNSFASDRQELPVAKWEQQYFALQNAGLGCRKVVFHCKASFINIKTKLESVYPKLIQGGGFEILRSVSPLLPGGYSVSFLRDSAGLGQALAYIRPLQKDLDTSVLQNDELIFSVWQTFL